MWWGLGVVRPLFPSRDPLPFPVDCWPLAGRFRSDATEPRTVLPVPMHILTASVVVVVIVVVFIASAFLLSLLSSSSSSLLPITGRIAGRIAGRFPWGRFRFPSFRFHRWPMRRPGTRNHWPLIAGRAATRHKMRRPGTRKTSWTTGR